MNEQEIAALHAALRRMRLIDADESPPLTVLTGGVSSLIARADTRRGPVCVKQALPRLRVAAVWLAPVERNAAETAWMRVAAGIVPDAVPALLGEDPIAHAFAMVYLDPARYRNWKTALRDGEVDPAVAAMLGDRLGCVHAATAADPSIAARFAHDDSFASLRLEPYLLETARNEPDVAARLHELRDVTARTKRVLVHGDVSPKNVLVGPHGPVLLDAECAWYGDPAFDLAFCLNHLLLKCAWRPASIAQLMESFDEFSAAYFARVKWEDRAALDARASALLPALLLARMSGKSPVEYLGELHRPADVKAFAKQWLRAPALQLAELGAAWSRERTT